jgi:hypothetical protein
MATPETTVIDPFDSASDAHALSAEYYGEVILDAWHCVLEKGSGKRPFNPQSDDPTVRCTAVDIVVLPLAEANLKFSLERKLLAESKAWTGLTWPSLQRLGLVNAREAKNRFCRVKLTPTGRTWIGSDGEKREETTFDFIELYADESSCKAAYAIKNGGQSGPIPAAAPTNPVQPVGADELARKTALIFAKAIVTNLARAEKDPLALQLKVAEKIAAMPMVGKYFTAEAPEVLQLIAEALVAA